MPLYAYRCDPCRVVQEEIRCIKDRHDAPECGICGEAMELEIAPVNGRVVDPAVPRRAK